MKRPLLILTAVLLATPAFSQTNRDYDGEGEFRRHESPDGRKGEKGRFHDLTPEEKEKMQEQRLQLMEKTLKNIGVTEEQKVQIVNLQKKLKDDMRNAFLKVEEYKKTLAELEKSGATEDEIYAAIDKVSDAQADQMKILARNRMQMERILGKEKFKLFMESARRKYREHGRGGGPGLPPKPAGVPPVPTAQEASRTPSQTPPIPAS